MVTMETTKKCLPNGIHGEKLIGQNFEDYATRLFIYVEKSIPI